MYAARKAGTDWLPWLRRDNNGSHPVHNAASISWYVCKRFYDDNGLGVASALTYTSLLGLVPMLTIFLAILSGFPAFGDMRDQIKEFVLSPLVPEAGDVVRDHINLFLSNTQQLTAFGVIGLALTSFLLLWTIESAFNTIWRVVEARPWSIRLLAFWAILTLSPLIVGISLSVKNYFEALALAAGLGDTPAFLERVPHFIPLVMQFIAFSLLFWIIPHRRVRLRHCLIGGLVAALLFEMLKWGFSFYLTRAETYRIIYGTLATIPIFLLWLYLSWSVILFGAEVAAAIPDWRVDREAELRGRAPPAEQLAIAIAILRAISSAQDRERLHRDELEKAVPGGSRVFARALARLLAAGYVASTEDDCVVIARDLGGRSLFDLCADLGLDLGTDIGPEFAEIYDLAERARRGWTGRLSDTLIGLHRAKRELMGQSIRSYVTDGSPRDGLRVAE